VLVVITILAVLAALGTVGIMRAMDSARQSRIKVEIDNLDAALKQYKDRYGSYPPCDLYYDTVGGGPGPRFRAVMAHIARAFPRYNLGTNGANLKADLQAAGLDLNEWRPDQALVFWLNGFSPDPANPFIDSQGRQIVNGTAGGAPLKVAPLFSFDKSRLVSLPSGGAGGAPYPSYVPQGVKSRAPYVYFDSIKLGDYANSWAWNPSVAYDPSTGAFITTAGIVLPYVTDADNNKQFGYPPDESVNVDGFQLIATGMDGKYSSNLASGDRPFYPLGQAVDASNNLKPLDPAYDDNIANFCERARLSDAKP
jgi:type II secretory pathway pseudopilin PulG